MTDAGVIDLTKLRRGKRSEINTPYGHVIADPKLAVKVGKYQDSAGIPHACLSISDPQVENGAPRIYLIPKSGALSLGSQLRQLASEVAV